MNEADLKRKLIGEIRNIMPGAVIFRHEDRFTAGIPDISITYADRTLWVEVKYSRPGRTAKVSGAQRLILSRLAKHGRIILLTYSERRDGTKYTDADVSTGQGDLMQNERAEGFQHEWAASIIQRELRRPLVRSGAVSPKGATSEIG